MLYTSKWLHTYLLVFHIMNYGADRLPLPHLQRSSPSSEMVMIDRTFNQEERSNLTQDKRMVLVDPGKINKFLKNG